MKAFTDSNGAVQPKTELQGLFCEDVLRDWIQQLEEQVADSERSDSQAKLDAIGSSPRQ